MNKKTIRGFIFLFLAVLAVVSVPVYAHPGRTDGAGGHMNHSTGEYHYHHGYDDHQHYDMDGDGIKDCPYKFKNNKAQSAKTETKSNKVTVLPEKQDKGVSFPETLAIIILCFVVLCYFVPIIAGICGGACDLIHRMKRKRQKRR